jgi:outer membrane protein OmpA-like peptidoglycan-associated protein
MRFPTAILVIGLLATPISHAHAQDAPAPVPYLSVLPNYEETYQADKEFDAYEFTNGKSMTHVEGKYWERQYRPKEGVTRASVLQMKRNYTNAVKAMGGVVIFDGNDEGGSPILVLKASKPGKNIWIQLNCDPDEYYIRMVEEEAMKQDITSSGLLKALESQGHVALDVRFATSKADILPESKPVLDQMIALLKENPALKVSIEGHTDNAGDAKANKGLSERRATSVMTALKAAGIAPGRLTSAGWGSEKPVADNTTEAGRANNRRVELVKK